jgi:hypothetical protein
MLKGIRVATWELPATPTETSVETSELPATPTETSVDPGEINIETSELPTETSVDPGAINETSELSNGFGVPWPEAPVFHGSTPESLVYFFDAPVEDVEDGLLLNFEDDEDGLLWNFEDDGWNLSNLNPSG